MHINELFDKQEAITLNSYLIKCGVKDIDDFINPSGKHLDNCLAYTNMLDGVNMLKYHILINDDIYILCDSGDTDGITSTVILYQYLSILNPNIKIKILIHEGKQRGLQDDELFNEVINNPKGLLIIPDSGTNDKERVDIIYNTTNMDVLVIDHHSLKTPISNGCLITNQDGVVDISPHGSGCLVTHKFLEALDKQFDLHLSHQFIDMVALSLLSDSMPMYDEQNRTYYHYGLETIDCILNPFLKQLIISFIGDKPYTQRDISFKVIPKINSICRSKDQQLKQRVIMCFLGYDNIDEVLDLCANAHKQQIDTVSDIVQRNEDKISTLSNNNLIIIDDDLMPQSYSGLVSAKIMKLCDGKPTICGKIKDGIFLGSLRSPIPLRKQLDENPFVEWASGHEGSCGVEIKSENIPLLIDYYNSIDMDFSTIDTVVKSYSIKSIPNKLYDSFCGNMTPIWGKEIPLPQFHITNIVFSPNDIRILGANRRTLKLSVNGIDILFFNVSNQDKDNLYINNNDNDDFVYNAKQKKYELEIIGTLNVNIWNGNKTNQIIVDKYEIKEYNRSQSDIF